jgi:hypothetical protein
MIFFQDNVDVCRATIYFQLRAVKLPRQRTRVKIESYAAFDCSTHMLILFEHGLSSIRDYVLVEILAETIQESLDDYLQCAGINHFTCHGNFEIKQSKIKEISYEQYE